MMSELFREFMDVFRIELRRIFHGRVPLACLLIGTPLGFTLIFGAIYAENVVNDIPLVVYDEDQSTISRSLIEAYDNADRFTVVSHVSSEEEMRAELWDGHALAALEIPKDFSKDIRMGNGADYLFMVNSANNMFGNASISASGEIERSFSIAVSRQLLEGVNILPQQAAALSYPVRMGVRITGNPANGYSSFMLSGLMMNGLQIGLMVSLAPLIITEILERRFSRKYPSWLLVLAASLPYLILAFVGFLLSMLVCIYIFAVPMRGSWFDAAAIGGTFLLFVAGVLHLFSSCIPLHMPSPREFSLQIPMVYIMPGVLYSGLSWPTFDMNSVASAFEKLLPMTYAGDALRDVMLSGYAPELSVNCLVMTAFGIGFGGLATCIFHIRRRKGFVEQEEKREMDC